MRALEPAGLGPDLHDREVGVVVDPDRRLGQPADGVGDLLPVGLGQVAVAHLLGVDPGLGAEHALGELELAHLEREEQHRPVGLERGVGGHAERAAPSCRPTGGRRRTSRALGCRPDEQLVEVDVAGGHAGDRLAPLVELLEPVEVWRRAGRGSSSMVSVTRRWATSNTMRLGLVDGLGDVVGQVVAHLGDLAGHPISRRSSACSSTILA